MGRLIVRWIMEVGSNCLFMEQVGTTGQLASWIVWCLISGMDELAPIPFFFLSSICVQLESKST